MGLIDILTRFGFDPACRARMARHQDSRASVDFDRVLRDDAEFESYIRWQSRRVYGDAEFVVSFVGDGAGRARFRAVHRVLGHAVVSRDELPEGVPWDWDDFGDEFHRYDLSKVSGYEPLEGNLVIAWSAERVWVQHLRNNEVLECPALP